MCCSMVLFYRVHLTSAVVSSHSIVLAPAVVVYHNWMMVIVFSLQYHRHPRESCCMMVIVFSLQYHRHPRESCCMMVVFCSFQGVPCCSPLPDQHVGSHQRDLQQSSRRFGPRAQNRFSTRSVPVPHSMSLQLYGVWWLQKIASTECVLR